MCLALWEWIELQYQNNTQCGVCSDSMLAYALTHKHIHKHVTDIACTAIQMVTVQGYQASIYVDPSVKTYKFCRTRSVPFALQPKVYNENYIIWNLAACPVAEYAAPTVPVLKRDSESVQICSDLKQMANVAAKVDHYPLPMVVGNSLPLTCYQERRYFLNLISTRPSSRCF